MGIFRHRGYRLAAAMLLLLSASALGISTAMKPRLRTSEQGSWEREQTPVARRWLVGPGSFPPRCRVRCGRCFPCVPVRVVIHPGRIVPLDYYPEVWRCKCHDKLFMP